MTKSLRVLLAARRPDAPVKITCRCGMSVYEATRDAAKWINGHREIMHGTVGGPRMTIEAP
jgi:hypothetical protein